MLKETCFCVTDGGGSGCFEALTSRITGMELCTHCGGLGIVFSGEVFASRVKEIKNIMEKIRSLNGSAPSILFHQELCKMQKAVSQLYERYSKYGAKTYCFASKIANGALRPMLKELYEQVEKEIKDISNSDMDARLKRIWIQAHRGKDVENIFWFYLEKSGPNVKWQTALAFGNYLISFKLDPETALKVYWQALEYSCGVPKHYNAVQSALARCLELMGHAEGARQMRKQTRLSREYSLKRQQYGKELNNWLM